MFVKLLTLLISNIFISFSVLVCCRSLARRCGLKGGIEQRTNLVPVSVLKSKSATIERIIHDRVHSTSARYSCVALAIASMPASWVSLAVTGARA